VLSGRGLCDELITRPEESYRLCCVVVCDLETSRMGAPYIYDSHLRVNCAFVGYNKMLPATVGDVSVMVLTLSMASLSFKSHHKSNLSYRQLIKNLITYQQYTQSPK